MMKITKKPKAKGSPQYGLCRSWRAARSPHRKAAECIIQLNVYWLLPHVKPLARNCDVKAGIIHDTELY